MNDYERQIFKSLEDNIESTAEMMIYKQELIDTAQTILLRLKEENDRGEKLLCEMKAIVLNFRQCGKSSLMEENDRGERIKMVIPIPEKYSLEWNNDDN